MATTLWSVENIERPTYFEWSKTLRARLDEAKLDYASRQIKDSNSELKLCINYVQMEYYASGNLKTWLECNSDTCKEAYVLRMELFCDILSAVDFLHDRGLMHRDICPNNIFLTMENDELHAILGDFDSIVSCGEQAKWPLTKARETLTRTMGTDPYAAPEIYGGNYDKQCDLYSLGVIVLNLFFNILDFKQLLHALYNIRENVYPTCIFADKSTLWLDVLKSQLSGAPERRMTSCQLLDMLKPRKQLLYLLEPYNSNGLIKLNGFQCGWTRLSSMPEPQRRGFSVAAYAGKVFVVGGQQNAGNNWSACNLVQQYDTKTGWQNCRQMLQARIWCGAAALGGRLFAVGGCGSKEKLSSVEQYDFETGLWTAVAPISAARQCMGVTALGNLLFAVGGVDGKSYLNSVEWYDPRARKWTNAAPMHEPRGYFGCTALDDRLYVAGGWNKVGKVMASVEWFDLRAGRWTRVHDMGAPREHFALAVLNGQLLAGGGLTAGGGELLDTVEAYDDKRDMWMTLGIRLPHKEQCVGCVLDE